MLRYFLGKNTDFLFFWNEVGEIMIFLDVVNKKTPLVKGCLLRTGRDSNPQLPP